MSVGLAGGDAEVPGQDSAGQGHHHLVPHLKVVRTADNALHTRWVNAVNIQSLRRALGHHTDRAPVDGLAVGLCLGLLGQHLTHHNGSADLRRGTVYIFFFETDLDKVGHDVFSSCSCRYLRVLAQPSQWNTHGLDLHPKVFAKTYIALDHVVHVPHFIAEHESALNAHAKGET